MSKLIAAVALAVSVAACTAKPPTEAKQDTIDQQAGAVLGEMRAKDPGLDPLLNASAAFAIFPEVGSAGAIAVGGSFGRGVLYEHGVATGYVALKRGSIGPQLGGQTFAELLVLRDKYDVERLKAGTFELGADATAVVLNSGAAASARVAAGTSVFVLPRGGLMAGISLSGQQIDFSPRG